MMIFDMPYPLIRYNDITRLNIWIYTKKVGTKQNFILHFSKHKGGMFSNATISCVGSFISLPPILFGSVILLILGSIVLGISFVL